MQWDVAPSSTSSPHNFSSIAWEVPHRGMWIRQRIYNCIHNEFRVLSKQINFVMSYVRHTIYSKSHTSASLFTVSIWPSNHSVPYSEVISVGADSNERLPADDPLASRGVLDTNKATILRLERQNIEHLTPFNFIKGYLMNPGLMLDMWMSQWESSSRAHLAIPSTACFEAK